MQSSAPSGRLSSSRLLEDVADELMPAVLWPDARLRRLVAGWLAGFRSPRTRRAYAGDLLVWQQWCDARALDPLRARRVQADLYLGDLIDGGAAPATASRKLSALSSFYASSPSRTTSMSRSPTLPPRCAARPWTPSTRPPSALPAPRRPPCSRPPDRARGPQRLRNAAILRLLLHNGLRLDELLGADLADLGRHPGRENVHDTLTIRRKGGRRARIALAPATLDALQRYLQERGDRRGTTPQSLTGPLFTSARERRLTPKTIWESLELANTQLALPLELDDEDREIGS